MAAVADVSDSGQVNAMFDAVLEAHGTVDVLVNNAGYVHYTTAFDCTEADWDRICKGQLVGIAVGTLLGSLAGSEVGKSLDRADRMYLQKTTQRSLETVPSGKTSNWSNPDSGNSGTITPQRTYQKAEGTYCREFQQTISVGGRTEEAYGTACRQAGGAEDHELIPSRKISPTKGYSAGYTTAPRRPVPPRRFSLPSS